MKRALVCASFGTTTQAGQVDLQEVEEALKKTGQGYDFARAWTSRIIRKKLSLQGVMLDSVPQALEKLQSAGCTEVIVQPTHLLYGYEYDKIKAEISPFVAQFEKVILGEPLLAGNSDLQNVASVLGATYPLLDGEALLLMGHGTTHFAGVVYPALQSVFTLQGRPDVFVAAVEGWPSLQEILPRLQTAGYKRVHLVPLLLVAGEHTCRDMAGDDPESWKSQLEANGFQVRCTLEGLGRLPGIQQLYREKLEKILE